MADDVKVLIGEKNGTELEYPEEYTLNSDNIPYDNSNSNLEAQELQQAIDELASTALAKNFYVAKNGDDVNGDGTLIKPFASITACIAYINANYTLSDSSNAVIRVAAGEYTSDTINLPSFCSIWGHHYRTRITASSGSINLIQSGGSHTIKGLLLTGVTNSANYVIKIDTATGKRVTLQDISFSNYEQTGDISNALYINNQDNNSITTVRLKQIDFGDVTGKLVHLDTNSRVVIRGAQIFDCSSATFVDANNNCSYSVYNVDIDNINIGVYHKNSEESELANINALAATIPLIKLNNYPLYVRSVTLTSTTAQILTLEGIIGYWSDVVEGDTSFRIANELAVGTSNKGKESVFGEGDSYTIGMNVYTSDGTDTATSEGTLTDVTTEASSKDTSYFGFQGTSTNYCIYVCTDVQNDAFGSVDYARIMGLKIDHIIACVESTEKSIIFESWDGSAWVEGSVLATQSSKFYRYGNDLFLRANNSEHIRFGRDLIIDSNVKKTIEGKERYWIRIRIKNTVTTAPTFNKFKISNNRTEINSDGTITFHGLSRFVQALPFQSNTFGETGGVTNGSVDIGATVGDSPHDSWTHSMKNNQLNGNNDAIYADAIIPEGCCTSCPITLKLKYIVVKAGTGNATFKVSMFPSRAEGVPVADKGGAIVPISRPTSYCSAVNTGVAQKTSFTIDTTLNNIINTATTQEFSAVDYYEGDLLFFRIGLDQSAGSKIIILGVDLEYVKWTLGDRI